ncbi:hypothetical protein B580_25045 [Salmonella enterica subsp. enterica serovar Typhimurium str. STm12]|nr:hypothetical protein B580_25045 [Salmonella enterica subsp. enterica serovar Typhimurium str. STm12]
MFEEIRQKLFLQSHSARLLLVKLLFSMTEKNALVVV